MGFLPICRRAASMPHPFGLFPTNTPVLDAANGRKARYCVTSIINFGNYWLILGSLGGKQQFFNKMLAVQGQVILFEIGDFGGGAVD